MKVNLFIMLAIFSLLTGMSVSVQAEKNETLNYVSNEKLGGNNNVKSCAIKKYSQGITVTSPTSSTYVYAGSMMEVTWNTQYISNSETMKITIIANGETSFVTCSNSHTYNVTMPNITETDNNAVIAVSILNNSQVYDFSETFTIDATQEYVLEVSDFDITSSTIQQGAPTTINATIINNGSISYNGALAFKWFDSNGNLLSIIDDYVGVIGVNQSIEIGITNQTIVSDVGNFVLQLQYLEPSKGSNIVLESETMTVNGLNVSGLEIPEVIIYEDTLFSSTIASPTQQNPPLLSILSVKNNTTNQTEYIFLNEVSSQNNGNGEEYEFDLDYLFNEIGEYTLQYIGLYDWEGKGFDSKNASWYYSYGVAHTTRVIKRMTISDLTNYPDPVYKKITSFTGDNAFKIQIDDYNPDQNIAVEAIFTREGSDPISLSMTNDHDNVWILEKDFMNHIGWYNLEYKATQSGRSTSEITEFYSCGFIEQIVGNGVVNTQGEFVFSFENYGLNIADAKIKFFTPSHNLVYKDMIVGSGNNYVLSETSLSSAGYYTYRYIVTTTDGTEIKSEAYKVFTEFGDNCDVIEEPGMVSRDKWCSGCDDNGDNPNSLNGTPTHVIIHHSVTNNGNDSYEIVNSLRDADITSNYGDIAYHYLIGSDGRIYEGLIGGPDRKGYHFSVMNSHTIGICLLGTFHLGWDNNTYYNGTSPSLDAQKSLDLLLEWICSEYQIDPIGIKDHHYPVNQVNENMPQIAPHNIANNYGGATVCPGNLFPNVVSIIAPNVFYCPEISSHQGIELSSEIVINSSNGKSRTLTSNNINISTSAIVLEGVTNARFRAILYNESDTLFIGETEYFELTENQSQEIILSETFDLESGTEYFLKVEYNIDDHEEWNMVLSETFDNDFEVSVEDIITFVDEQSSNNYKIYPNPSMGTIFIVFDKNINRGNVSVANIFGNIIEQKSLNKNTTIKQLSPGIYFIRLEYDGRMTTEKIVVY